MDEKDLYNVEHGMTDAEREKVMVERKGSMIGEGAVMYGDVATAEQYGYVERALKARHVQFIALGGTIGTGLFVGIAGALASTGPLSILLGYSLTGLFIFGMMQSLGEMVTWLPMPGAIPQMAARYYDPALGFAVGWNQWYANALTQCSEISAAAVVIGYWNDTINPSAWVGILIVVIFCLNIFAVSIYGEAEFWFASIKLVTILGLLILAFIIDLGGSPRGVRLGFHYWKHPGAMVSDQTTAAGNVYASGNFGRFLSFFNTLINAAFSYGGVEMVAVAAGEAEDPRRNIPKAVRRTFWRIIAFYVLGSLAIGVLVPYNDPRLGSESDAAGSPWVIGIEIAQIKVLPSIINAVILTSATSSGNAFLYAGSRYLFGIAQNGQAPKIFLKCSRRGLPYVAVIFTALFALLTFMATSKGAGVVFFYFYNITTVANLWTWVGICLSAIGWQRAIKAQGVDRRDLPMRTPFQPYLAWSAMIFFLIIILFNGYSVFVHNNWSTPNFIVAYIGIPIFLFLYLFWKILKRTPFVRPHDCDLWTGKAAIDAQVWPDRTPRNFIERIWFWIA